MEEKTQKVLADVITNEYELNEFKRLKTADEMYTYFASKIPELSKKDFKNFITKIINEYKEKEETIKNIDLSSLENVSGGIKKSQKALVGVLSFLSFIPGVATAAGVKKAPTKPHINITYKNKKIKNHKKARKSPIVLEKKISFKKNINQAPQLENAGRTEEILKKLNLSIDRLNELMSNWQNDNHKDKNQPVQQPTQEQTSIKQITQEQNIKKENVKEENIPKQETQEQEAQEQKTQEKEAQEQEAQEQEAQEQEAQEQEAQEQEAQEQKTQEQETQEQETQEQENQEQENQEREIQEQEIQEQETQEQENQEQENQEQENQEQENQEQENQEQEIQNQT